MHVDLGSGDARGPLRWARRDTDWIVLATDLNPDVLAETAGKAARKQSRGGVSNLLCVAEPLEVLATELPGVAQRVTALLPWGSLLVSLIRPEPRELQHLRLLGAVDAGIEIVFSYESRDASENGRLPVDALQEAHVKGFLTESYRRSGFRAITIEQLSASSLAEYETTWARRLAFGQPRTIWRLRAIAAPKINP